MPKSQFVDFKAVKSAVKMEEVLQHYGLLDRFKRSGDSLSGPCPIHKGSNPTQFRVSVSKNVWNCFSECKNGGNVLDFFAKMEDISIHAAAVKAIEWFQLDPAEMAATSEAEPTQADDAHRNHGESRPKPVFKPATPESAKPNPALKFRLDKLDRNHPYLAERGLTPETVEDFDLGFCSKGRQRWTTGKRVTWNSPNQSSSNRPKPTRKENRRNTKPSHSANLQQLNRSRRRSPSAL